MQPFPAPALRSKFLSDGIPAPWIGASLPTMQAVLGSPAKSLDECLHFIFPDIVSSSAVRKIPKPAGTSGLQQIPSGGWGSPTFEPIDPPRQAIRAWIPADDDEPGSDTPELWDQTISTGREGQEIDPGEGRTLILDESWRPAASRLKL